MKTVEYSDGKGLERLVNRPSVRLDDVFDTVKPIIAGVRDQGDAALFLYSKKFDGFDLSIENIKVPPEDIKKARSKISPSLEKALLAAASNIKKFHKTQYENSVKHYSVETAKGITITEKTVPLPAVGCYVPGGRATYPSTVLMTCIPAKVAGVERVVVVSPPPVKPEILAACDICGVDEVYRAGGAQAVAALAYGTKSIGRVDKIVGPGNKYVMAAKLLVYGKVDIDMPAGPSEVLILADKTANPAYIASDMLAQAEHDPDAQSLLVTDSREIIANVEKEITRQLKNLPRKDTMTKSLENSAAVLVKDVDEAVDYANTYAPEHLEIMTSDPQKTAEGVRNAGTIFLGGYAPVPAGDYASGGNHVLPTGGAARFSSELSVRDFLRTYTIQDISKEGLFGIRGTVEELAVSEGLQAHAEAVKRRFLA